MTAQNYAECIKRLLVHEGGYTNDPRDPGGPTNFGITIADYRRYKKPGATAADIRAMKVADAKDIYRSKYWGAQRCDALPSGLDDTIFDYGVNSGIGRSGKVLRRVLGLADDTGAVTDEVLRAVARRDVKAIIVAVNDERLAFLKRLRTWPAFGAGWGRRVAEVKAFSLHLADHPADTEALPGRIVPVKPPTPRPTPSGAAPGKGEVAAPETGRLVAGGGSAQAPVTGGLAHMLGADPLETMLIMAAGVVAIGGGIAYAAHRWHRATFDARQQAPTPGTPVVPVVAASA